MCQNTEKYASLAQLVEHLTLNQGVRGSNPRRSTNYETPYRKIGCFVIYIAFCRFNRGQRGLRGRNSPVYRCLIDILTASDYHFGGDRVARPAKRGQSPLWKVRMHFVRGSNPRRSTITRTRSF